MSLLDSEIEVINKVSIKDLIIEWLEKYNIKNYKINDDFTIDINGNVDLSLYSESQLPNYIRFNEVDGCFDISYSKIENLNGCPKIVSGYFDCSCCQNLKTLKGAPEIVKGGFNCSRCTKLKTLKGAPEIVKGGFNCYNCKNLKSFKGAPKIVNYNFNYSNHEKFESPKRISKLTDEIFFI